MTGSARQFGQVFDDVADEYDAVRSGYPPALVDLALERGGLRAGSRVVEVGSGTGKLTEQLVARGLVVDAVEPGPRMIASARRRVGDDANVTFHEGRFEEADLPAEAFAGLFSATAFHWIDPQVGWAKAASLLEPGGLLALLTHSAVHDDDTDAVYGGLLEIMRRHAPHIAERWRPPLELTAILDGAAERSDNASEVWDWLMGGRHELGIDTAAPLFDSIQVASDVRVQTETADEWLALMRTTSTYLQLEPQTQAALEEDDRQLIDDHGGSITTTIATLLMTARRA